MHTDSESLMYNLMSCLNEPEFSGGRIYITEAWFCLEYLVLLILPKCFHIELPGWRDAIYQIQLICSNKFIFKSSFNILIHN